MSESFYDLQTLTLQGKSFSFGDLRGKVCLIVNIASKCGRAPQLEGLQKLYEKYKDKGFAILAFPSDQFHQEPLEGERIEEYCSINYGVTFPIMEKTKVRGKDAHPVFSYFSSKNKNGVFASKPYWNFYKYLIGRDGKPITYFWSYKKPGSKKIIRAIEKALEK
ncbi:MAG: glutathione peroxidase [Chitinophagales bacterium]